MGDIVSNELKPCPFCGGEAEMKVDELRLYKSSCRNAIEATVAIRCKKCFFRHTSWDIRIPIDENTLELKSTLEIETKHIVEKWNRRYNNG